MSQNALDIVGQNKARQKRLSILAEIGCILLFILFMMPFFIVLLNSARTNAEIINAALTVLRKNMRRNEGKPFAYKKAGVILWNITPQSAIQQDLFDPIDRQRQAALTKAIDEINRKNGYNTVRLASQGTDIRFSLLREHISKNFTTNINDVLVAKV